MKSEITVRRLPEAEWPAWNRLVSGSPEGSVYSTPEYLALLCNATGGRFRVLAAERGGELLGGVALYEEASRFGTWLSPRLLLFYNGLVLRAYDGKYPSQRTARQTACFSALERALVAAGYARLVLKNRSTVTDVRVFLARGWTARPSYSYVVPLGDLKGLWGRVEQNLRRLVERCRGQGLRVTEDGDFDPFYAMHQKTHERKRGAALYLPRERFRRFVDRLRSLGLGRLYHARLPDGRSVSSQLVLVGNPVTHTVAAAADPEFLNLGAAAFLRWEVFEDLARHGYVANDLTDAPLSSVTHFKSQLGGDLHLCVVLERPDAPILRAARAASRVKAWLQERPSALARTVRGGGRGREGD